MAPETPRGLDSAAAAALLRTDGPNELGVSQRRTLRDIAWEVVREPMFLLLLGAGSIYLLTGDTREAVVVGLYALALQRGLAAAAAATAAFVVLVAANAVLILPSRSAWAGWRTQVTGLTRTSLGVLAATFAALVVVTTVGPVAKAFGFATLAPLAWLGALATGLGMLVVFQVAKRMLGSVASRGAGLPA